MKIALVSPYDFVYPGGVVNHILALNNQFTKMGHDVRIIAPASRVVVDDAGCQFVPIGKARSIPVRGTTIRIAISLRLASEIKEVLAREKFDIIHLHEPFMPMLCSAVIRFSDTVNIGTFHAAGSKPGYYWGWPISAVMLHRRRQKLVGRIAVSKLAMNNAIKHVPGHYDIIPNGIDLEHFSSSVLPIEEFCDGKKNILFVGRLEKRKGMDYLLKAYEKVKKECPESRLIIVGPGTRSRHKYEKQVSKKGLTDVVFVGNVSYDELPRYYKTADIFCAPATGQESFGIVLLDAMAVGTPVVATNIDGYAGVMTNEQEGLLVPPKNEHELARALLKLMSDDSLRQQMGDSGLATAQKYDWEKVVKFKKEVIDLIQKAGGEIPETACGNAVGDVHSIPTYS
ncbi:MAG: glycosyltransferase family 4 protein, partial [Dehalococcoidales bacterium]|nr:glycosyltransferase family 4 protein [Dehalococcoidales bacterium]